uniref:hypothetical protein n=1 Tax=Dialister sp. UBA1703 TaxID=1946415 RepID=UPI0025C162F3
PELYRNTDKTEATEIVIIDSQMNYRGKLDTYLSLSPSHFPVDTIPGGCYTHFIYKAFEQEE